MAGSTEQPWWRRTWAMVTGAVLAAGALASAVTAVLGLVSSGPDLTDKAEIISIDLIPGVPLSEYERRAGGPLSHGESPELRLVGHVSSAEETEATTAEAEPDPAPTPEPSPGPTESPSPASSSPTGPTTDDPTEPTGSTSPPANESPPIDPRLEIRELAPGIVVDESRYRDTLDEAARSAPDIDLPDAEAEPSRVVLSLVSTMEDDEGNPVPPEEAARRLVQVLGNTRAVETPAGTLDPLGVIVTANLQLEGLAGRELGVFWEVWSQSGTSRLYDRWLDEVPVSRIRAERDTDAGALQFWVPMPKKPGEYVIHVIIRDGDRLLFIGRSDPFE